MSEEILEHLIEYLQQKIDSGEHKIFYNDLMYDEKTIDCINAINDTLEENKRLNNIINELKEDIVFCINGMKNEYACTDSRTNRELHIMVKILEESLDKIKELKGDDSNGN